MKNLFSLFMLLFFIMQSFAQSNNSSLKKDTVYWVHQYTYDRLIQRKIFAKGMSDDEMAGILLYRGGNNLKVSFACEFFGALSGSLMLTITNQKAQTAIVILAVASTTFLITGIVELISGYNKISKAGIILQHKGINIKTSGTGISVNF